MILQQTKEAGTIREAVMLLTKRELLLKKGSSTPNRLIHVVLGQCYSYHGRQQGDCQTGGFELMIDKFGLYYSFKTTKNGYL